MHGRAGLGFREKWRMRHRFWRVRFKSEAPSIRLIRELPLAGCTLIDIGANRGVFSYYMSRRAGPTGRVIAFEVQPELGPHLERLRKTFRLENLEIVNCGLSSRAGSLTLRRPGPGSGMAGFHHERDAGLEEIAVPVATLDGLVRARGAPRVRFIKCDVEGHELEVFRGAAAVLRDDGPALLFECHHEQASSGELFRFLTDLGYDGYFFHVDPRDHKSITGAAKGHYVHFSEYDRYPYVRPGIRHRNYVFLRDPDRLPAAAPTS